jgi:hypothetical protein
VHQTRVCGAPVADWSRSSEICHSHTASMAHMMSSMVASPMITSRTAVRSQASRASLVVRAEAIKPVMIGLAVRGFDHSHEPCRVVCVRGSVRALVKGIRAFSRDAEHPARALPASRIGMDRLIPRCFALLMRGKSCGATG